MKQKIMSGMRPTGKLHLGHYLGVIDNWVKLQEMAAKKAVPKDNGKAHLKTVTGSSEKAKTRNISTDEMKVFNMFGFSAEQARDYVNRTNK